MRVLGNWFAKDGMRIEEACRAKSKAQRFRPAPARQSARPWPLHFRAAAAAAMVAIGFLSFSAYLSHRLAKRSIHERGWEYSLEKNQGIAWQKAAFAEPDVLPLYGSSELIKPASGEAYLFFRQHPSGFVVSPVGRGGCTSLVLLEKIASAGGDAPHHKMAICVSPSWFFGIATRRTWYGGNFSARQACGLIFSRTISLDLKRDIARRMLDYPQTLAGSSLLSFAVRRLCANTNTDLAFFHAAEPFGWMINALAEAREDIDLAWDVLGHRKGPSAPSQAPASLNWPGILSSAAAQERSNPRDKNDLASPPIANSALANYSLSRSREWSDLELLLRVSQELQLDTLLIAIPMDCRYLESLGLSPANMDAYTLRLRNLSQRYGVAIVDFADHENDNPYYFTDHHDHPGVRGWLFMDEALDHFFHASPNSRDREQGPL
jgi:D-alanine transfer protein